MLLAALLAGAVAAGPAPAAVPPTTRPWQWQLQGRIGRGVEAPLADLDPDAPGVATAVRAFRARGTRTACYVSVGSWEPFRSDAPRFPRSLLGRRYAGFEDERWLDVRRIAALAPLLRARFDACARLGFDAVEPDNVDGWENRTGFRITRADQLRFNRWVAAEVRDRGMAVALKNAGPLAAVLVPAFDFVIAESCLGDGACADFRPFLRAGKGVFVAEYRRITPRDCRASGRLRLSLIEKRPGLGPWRRTCGSLGRG